MRNQMRVGIALLSVLLLACALAGAANTLTVGLAGSGATYTSIQTAINAAQAGDTVQVFAGTYTGNIIMKNGVSVLGAGAGVTTITPSDKKKPVVSASGVLAGTALNGFTITNGYVTGTSTTGYPSNGGGMSIGSSSTLTVSNCTFSNNAASNSGGGIYINSSSPTLTNCTFSNNRAGTSGGGMYLYPKSGTTAAVESCTFSGNTSTNGGAMTLHPGSSSSVNYCTFSGNDATRGDVMSTNGATIDATCNWWGSALGPSADQFFGSTTKVVYSPWYATATTTPATQNVSVDHSGTIIAYSDTIQGGIDAGDGGCVVHVDGLTYTEQVVIDSDLSLIGAGSGTVIESPDKLTLYFLTGSSKNYPIIYVHDTDDALIQDLVVDGLGKGNANYRLLGIGFFNAGGTVDGVEIRNIEDTPFSGSQHGVGIYAYNADGTPRTLVISNCSIHDFQKNALSLLGAGLTIDVRDNTVTGAGPTSITAQNGIQVGSGASGLITGNTVSGIWYTGVKWGATGILIVGAAPGIEISGNDVLDCQMGINSDAAQTLVQGNTVRNSDWAVIFYGDDSRALDNDIADSAYGIYSSADNTLIERNVIQGSAWSVVLWGANGEVHYNSISGSTDGFYAPAATNATLNWWGDSAGPLFDLNADGIPEYDGLGEVVYGEVVFSPWLGTDPDGDPATPGVQVLSPMLIVVAPVGPWPTAGYLNAAIVGSNSDALPYADTIYVYHGAYDGSESITQPVTIVSEPGSTSHTTVTGAMNVGSGNVTIGLPLQGLRIDGDITVQDLVDAASVHINWCDLYGTATNNGDGTLDAQFNFWGTQEETVIDARTFGDIDYAPYLPKNADDSYSDITALVAAGLAGSLNGAIDQLWTLSRMGQDVGTYIEYQGVAGAGALHVEAPNGELLANLLPGGGGGAVSQTGVQGGYVVGETILGQVEVLDPVTGLPVTDAIVTISLLNSESGVVYWGVATYDESIGGYVFEVDTSSLAPGTYELIIQTDDGETKTLSVVVAEA